MNKKVHDLINTTIISVKSRPLFLDIATPEIDNTKPTNQESGLYSSIDRKFPLFGPIDEELTQSFIQTLITWMADSISEPVELWINSQGGNISHALALYDLIKYSPMPVHTIGIGEVCSAAVLLLASGTAGNRAAFPNCRIMMHSLSYGAEGTFQDMHVIFEEVKALQTKLAKMISTNTKIDEAQVLDMFAQNKDQWVTSEEAIELGIIDKIIKKDSNFEL